MQSTVVTDNELSARTLKYLVVPALSFNSMQVPWVADLLVNLILVVAVEFPPTNKFVPTEATPPTSNMVSVKSPALMPNLAVVEVSSNLSDTEALDKEVRPEVAVRVPPRVTLPEILAVPPTSSIVSVKPPALMPNLAVVEVSSNLLEIDAFEILAKPPTSKVVSRLPPGTTPKREFVVSNWNIVVAAAF